jgi:hypothetical protein
VKFNSQGVPYNPEMVTGGQYGAAPPGVRIPAAPSSAAQQQQQSYLPPAVGAQPQFALAPPDTGLWGNNYGTG